MTVLYGWVFVLAALLSLTRTEGFTLPVPAEASDDEICYPVVGCFSNMEPWTSPSRPAMAPKYPLNISTSMYFYSRELPDGVTFPVFPEINLSNVSYKGNRNTFVIYHDYLRNATDPWIVALKNAILKRIDANIIVPDNSGLGQDSYEQAAGDARVAGKLATILLLALDTNPSSTHLIGHNMGAQIASYTAKYLAEEGRKPARLTALDPAGPLFEGQDPSVGLTADDASLVDVLHSDINDSGTTLGHIDFFFDRGSQQPECEPSETSVSCSHAQAYDFYVEAVENDCMKGKPAKLEMDSSSMPQVILTTPNQGCKDDICVPVGLETAQATARGVFIVITNGSSPFCIPE